MVKTDVFGLVALAALAASTPAMAGPTEAAVALCKAEFRKQLGTDAGTPSLRIRSIDPRGRMTRVRIASTTSNVIDCQIDYLGSLVSAEIKGRSKAVQQANR